MASLLVRRTAQMLFVMAGISILVFLIFFATPGSDPASRIAGRNASPEVLAAVRHDFGLDRPLIDEANRDRPPGHCTAHGVGEMQRRAAFERLVNGVAILVAHLRRGVVACISHARRRDHFAVAPKCETNGVFHAGPSLVLWRRLPAGPERDEHVADAIQLAILRTVAFVVFVCAFLFGLRAVAQIIGPILIGRNDCEPQRLAKRRRVVRKTRAAMKYAAERRMAGMPAQDAARGSRRRHVIKGGRKGRRSKTGKPDRRQSQHGRYRPRAHGAVILRRQPPAFW